MSDIEKYVLTFLHFLALLKTLEKHLWLASVCCWLTLTFLCLVDIHILQKALMLLKHGLVYDTNHMCRSFDLCLHFVLLLIIRLAS